MKRFFGLGLAALALIWVVAGCANQGQVANDEDQGTKVILHFDNLTKQNALPLSVAVSIGNEQWKRILPEEDGTYSFYVPEGEKRYAVAVRCGEEFPMSAFASGGAYYLTTDLTTEPYLGCSTLGAVGGLSGTADVSALTGAQSLRVYSFLHTDEADNATTSNYSVMAPQKSDADIVLLAYSSTSSLSPTNLLGGRVFHDINVSGQTQQDLTLDASDVITAHNIDSFEVPQGWGGSYKANFFGSGGSAVTQGNLGIGNQAGGRYYTFGGTNGDDLFVVQLDANDGASLSLGKTYVMKPDTVGDLSPSFAMQPFPNGYSVAAATFPTFTLNHPDHPEGYFILTSWPFTTWYHLVTSAWLNGSTSFTVPDLTNIWGFADIAPAKGEEVSWFIVAFQPSISMGTFASTDHYFQDLVIPVPRLEMQIDSASVKGTFSAP